MNFIIITNATCKKLIDFDHKKCFINLFFIDFFIATYLSRKSKLNKKLNDGIVVHLAKRTTRALPYGTVVKVGRYKSRKQYINVLYDLSQSN